MDDDTGWNDVLVGVWSSRVREAAVARVERATVGARCLLVHTLSDPEQARRGWVEQLHGLVIDAIREETGADLDELGSQAAWTAYEEVWAALTERWVTGERFAVVPLRREPEADRLLRCLAPLGAQAAGMDVGADPPQPLWIDGRLHLDVEGLHACKALGDLDAEQRSLVDGLLALGR